MQICITQKDGIRYFSRFKNIPDRDRLEIELTIDDGRRKVYNFDLTDKMFEMFSQHPEILRKKRVIPRDYLPEEKPVRKRAKASKPVEPAVELTSPEPVAVIQPKKNGRKKSAAEEKSAKPIATAKTPAKKTRTKKAEAKEATPAIPAAKSAVKSVKKSSAKADTAVKPAAKKVASSKKVTAAKSKTASKTK